MTRFHNANNKETKKKNCLKRPKTVMLFVSGSMNHVLFLSITKNYTDIFELRTYRYKIYI